LAGLIRVNELSWVQLRRGRASDDDSGDEASRDDPGPHEHDEIERLLAKIHTALNLLDELSRGKPAKLGGLC